jgi:delta
MIKNSKFFSFFLQITCSGIFELRLKSFRNDNGMNSLGRCCGDKQLPNGSCQSSCKTRFRICLKQYQAKVDINSPCTFGDTFTQVLGDNSFNLTMSTTSTTSSKLHHQKTSSINPILFPFAFTWPVSIQLSYFFFFIT